MCVYGSSAMAVTELFPTSLRPSLSSSTPTVVLMVTRSMKSLLLLLLLLLLLGGGDGGFPQCSAQSSVTPTPCNVSRTPDSPGYYRYDASNVVPSDRPCSMYLNSNDTVIDIVGVVVYLSTTTSIRNVSIAVRDLDHAAIGRSALVTFEGASVTKLLEVHVRVYDCVNVTVKNTAMVHLKASMPVLTNCSFEFSNVSVTYVRDDATNPDGVLFYGGGLAPPLNGEVDCSLGETLASIVAMVQRRQREVEEDASWTVNVSITIRSVTAWSMENVVSSSNGGSNRLALASCLHYGNGDSCGGVKEFHITVEDTAMYVCPPVPSQAEVDATEYLSSVARYCGRRRSTDDSDNATYHRPAEVSNIVKVDTNKLIVLQFTVHMRNVAMESWRTASSRLLTTQIGGGMNLSFRVRNASLIGTSTMPTDQRSLNMIYHTASALVMNVSVSISDCQLLGFACSGACSWGSAAADNTSSVVVALLVASPSKISDSNASAESAAISVERCTLSGKITDGSFVAAMTLVPPSLQSLVNLRPIIEGTLTTALCSVTMQCSELGVEVRDCDVSGRLALAVNDASVPRGVGYAKLTGVVVAFLIPLKINCSSIAVRSTRVRLLGPTAVAVSPWNTTLLAAIAATSTSDPDVARYLSSQVPPAFLSQIETVMTPAGSLISVASFIASTSTLLVNTSVVLHATDEMNFVNRTYLRDRGMLSRHQSVGLVALVNANATNLDVVIVNSSVGSGSCIVQPGPSMISNATITLRNVSSGTVVQAVGGSVVAWQNVTLLVEGSAMWLTSTESVGGYLAPPAVVIPSAAVYGLGWPEVSEGAARVLISGSRLSLCGSVFAGYDSVLQRNMIGTSATTSPSDGNVVELCGCNGYSGSSSSSVVSALLPSDASAVGVEGAVPETWWAGPVSNGAAGLICTASVAPAFPHVNELSQSAATALAIAVVLGSASGNNELQALIALGSSSCSPATLQSISLAARVSLSPFYALGTLWAVVGNVLLSASVCGMQAVMVLMRQIERVEGLRASLTAAQAPQWSYRVWVLMHVGITRLSVALLSGQWDEGAGGVGPSGGGAAAAVTVGVLGLAWNVVALVLVGAAHMGVLSAKRGEIRVRPWGRAAMAAVVPGALRFAVPCERWVPDGARRRYGALVGAMRGDRRHWAVYPLLASSVLAVMGAAPFDSVDACVVPWVVSAVVGFGVGVSVGVARPHRSVLVSLQQSASYIVLGALSVCVACGVTSGAVLGVLSALQTLLSVLSAIVGVFNMVVERLMVLRYGLVSWDDKASVVRWLLGDTCFPLLLSSPMSAMPSKKGMKRSNGGLAPMAMVDAASMATRLWQVVPYRSGGNRSVSCIEMEQRLHSLIVMSCNSSKLPDEAHTACDDAGGGASSIDAVWHQSCYQWPLEEIFLSQRGSRDAVGSGGTQLVVSNEQEPQYTALRALVKAASGSIWLSPPPSDANGRTNNNQSRK